MFERSSITLFTLIVICVSIYFLRLFKPSLKPASTILITTLLIFFVTIFIGLRPLDAGNDTIRYAFTYLQLNSWTTAPEIGSRFFGSIEPFYWYFAYSVKLFGADIQFFLIISILLSTFLTFIAIKSIDSKKIDLNTALLLTLLVFCTYSIVYLSNHMRASIAIPLCLASFIFATRNKGIISLLLIAIAIGFHNSALLIVPALILGFNINPSNTRREKTFIILFLITCFLLSSSITTIFQTTIPILSENAIHKIYIYTNNQFDIQSVYTSKNFYFIILHIFVFIMLKHEKVHFYAYYVLSLILVLSPIPILADRYFAYLMPLLPALLYLSLSTRYSQTATVLILSAFYLISALALVFTSSVIYNLGI